MEAVRFYRQHGWSLARIAKKLDVSTSAVYYALHPKRRSREISTGAQRSVYIHDETWEQLGQIADDAALSRSAILVGLVEKAHSEIYPPEVVE